MWPFYLDVFDYIDFVNCIWIKPSFLNLLTKNNLFFLSHRINFMDYYSIYREWANTGNKVTGGYNLVLLRGKW